MTLQSRRFRSTVPYYAAYRVPYPERLVRAVAIDCGMKPGAAVLDLGCGPGPLAMAFARLGATVTAMDPEPEMLAAARRHAAEAGLGVTFLAGSSADLGRQTGRWQLAVMGRSFHWMDRAATLRVLDGSIEPGGAVVLFGDQQIRIPEERDWRAVLDRLGETFAPEGIAERRARRGPGWTPHEAVLLASPFRHLERHGVVVRRTLDADAIVGRAYSMSATSPEALGDRQAAFERELRRELAELAPDGIFRETVEVSALIATRDPLR